MASTRISRERIIGQLKMASRRGDRTALQLALGEMRVLAYSPKYWKRYLALLSHPLARLVDLLVIKQGDRIIQQKGRAKVRQVVHLSSQPVHAATVQKRTKPDRKLTRVSLQPSLFPELEQETTPPRKRRPRSGKRSR